MFPPRDDERRLHASTSASRPNRAFRHPTPFEDAYELAAGSDAARRLPRLDAPTRGNTRVLPRDPRQTDVMTSPSPPSQARPRRRRRRRAAAAAAATVRTTLSSPRACNGAPSPSAPSHRPPRRRPKRSPDSLPLPRILRRLMEPLPERAPEPEQWAKVSKGSGVAKSVAKSVAPARTSPAAPAGSNAAFDVLRKFANPADDGDDDDEAKPPPRNHWRPNSIRTPSPHPSTTRSRIRARPRGVAR